MEIPPVSPDEAEALHLLVMVEYPDEPAGVRDWGILESALMRPAFAAQYGGADEYTQVATLLWGLIRDHPFVQGNKRTATVIAFFFLERVGYRVTADEQAVVDLVYGIEEGRVTMEEVADWFRRHTVAPG